MPWQSILLTAEFISESCCFADVDGDGVLELVAGDWIWWLDGTGRSVSFRNVKPICLPDWPHDPASDPHPQLRLGGGPPQYKDSTYEFPFRPMGVSRDSIIWVGMHRQPIVWCENIGVDEHWPVHTITSGGVYESVVMADIRGTTSTALITCPGKPNISWYEPAADPRAPWLEHNIGVRGGDWHGLGVGDIDADGRVEVICRDVIYFQRDDPTEPWLIKTVSVSDDIGITDTLGDAFIFRVADFLNLGFPQLISSSPHKFGVWLWIVDDITANRVHFRKITLDDSVSQLHSLRVASPSLRKPISIFTGKRWHAHGPTGDVDSNGTPQFFSLSHTGNGSDVRKEIISGATGVGIHFDIAYDPSGDAIIATSNKLGLRVSYYGNSFKPVQRGNRQ